MLPSATATTVDAVALHGATATTVDAVALHGATATTVDAVALGSTMEHYGASIRCYGIYQSLLMMPVGILNPPHNTSNNLHRIIISMLYCNVITSTCKSDTITTSII